MTVNSGQVHHQRSHCRVVGTWREEEALALLVLSDIIRSGGFLSFLCALNETECLQGHVWHHIITHLVV